MLAKYKAIHFGRCPRVMCSGQPVLPMGQSDLPRVHTTKIFCPRCKDIYFPRSSRQANVDGAYFGAASRRVPKPTASLSHSPRPEPRRAPRP